MTEKLIVTVGGGFGENGILPVWVQNRLNLANELFLRNPGTKILLSGLGLGNPAESEALVMKRELLKRSSIPPEKILLEEKSLDSLGNAYYSRLIAESLNASSLIVITSQFHMDRIKFLFKWVFGNSSKITFAAAPDSGVNPESLQLRIGLEKELLSFYEGNFLPAAKAGDLSVIGSVVETPGHSLQLKLTNFLRELNSSRTLY